MQDKEFDQFIKDKLAQAEVTPPAMLWNKVDAQLETKRKKPFPMMWMAAAVAVVAVSAGLLFNQQEKIQLQGQPAIVTSSAKPVTETAPLAAETSVVTSQEALTSTAKQYTAEPVKSIAKKELLSMQPSSPEAHLDDRNNEVKQTQEETIVIRDVELASALTTPEEPIMAGFQETPQDALTDDENVAPERRGIRNVGDLVNFVVEKIDKREEKILKFNPDDDDQSSLVSINIGILKFNTKQRDKR